MTSTDIIATQVEVAEKKSMPTTVDEKVAVLTEFFSNRLLLKRYRKNTREENPAIVVECEMAFEKIARQVVAELEEGEPLDAMSWLDVCTDFSDRWIEVSHWISPKKFREFVSENIGGEWVRVEEIPAHKEQPPVDLKWYKNPEGCTPVQPCVCPLCNVVCNSYAQYKAHSQGRTHRALARARNRRGRGENVHQRKQQQQHQHQQQHQMFNSYQNKHMLMNVMPAAPVSMWESQSSPPYSLGSSDVSSENENPIPTQPPACQNTTLDTDPDEGGLEFNFGFLQQPPESEYESHVVQSISSVLSGIV
eukprot:TRINITY_DN984_c0_g1_i2.p1 TRINITY_DN984_c0_g1~~TRINITY_DN984_c0_g1_i2.p1  ORF type:complete len:306 (+),score=71.04 TRINITY_DN984_c0_g1_i2:78-995(+)